MTFSSQAGLASFVGLAVPTDNTNPLVTPGILAPDAILAVPFEYGEAA